MNVTAETFGYPETLIKEFEHWLVLLRPEQITIGTLVLVTKSEATHLGQLSQEQWADFANVCAFVEDLLRQKFGAEKFNYLALMMRDPNVHFHFIPRYSKPVLIGGMEYPDPDWPLKTEFNKMELSDEVLEKIKQLLVS